MTGKGGNSLQTAVPSMEQVSTMLTSAVKSHFDGCSTHRWSAPNATSTASEGKEVKERWFMAAECVRGWKPARHAKAMPHQRGLHSMHSTSRASKLRVTLQLSAQGRGVRADRVSSCRTVVVVEGQRTGVFPGRCTHFDSTTLRFDQQICS
jgi:hypothetical protein